MSETVNIFGKSYGVFEMSHKDKAVAWLRSAPTVDICVGKFTLTYEYGFERDWGSSWICWNDPDWEDTPEEQYFEELCDAINASCHDTSFIDEVIEAMKKKPFEGESE